MDQKDLLKLNFANFKPVLATEVFRINEDGKKTKSISFFLDPIVAEVFAKLHADSHLILTDKRIVITDGTVSFMLGEEFRFANEESIIADLKTKIMDKISEEEKNILLR